MRSSYHQSRPSFQGSRHNRVRDSFGEPFGPATRKRRRLHGRGGGSEELRPFWGRGPSRNGYDGAGLTTQHANIAAFLGTTPGQRLQISVTAFSSMAYGVDVAADTFGG